MRHRPPPVRRPLEAGEVADDDGVERLGGVVGPDEVGADLRQVAERADAAAAHGVEAEERAEGPAARRWRVAARTARSRPRRCRCGRMRSPGRR